MLAVWACAAGAASHAQTEAPSPSFPSDDPPLQEREQITGGWWGARDRLAAAGLTFDPFVVVDFSKNTRGGADTEGSALRHLLSLNMSADFDAMFGLTGGSAYIDFHQQAGQLGSDEVGDWQWVGSWDADGLTQVSELWCQQELFEGALRIKAGKIDANYEFAYTDLGWQFVHGSSSYPATNALMTTYPEPATGACLFVYPDDAWSFGAGLFDGAAGEGIRTGGRGPATFFGDPADLYLIAEVGLAWGSGEGGRPGRVGVGAWRHTGSFERWDGGMEGGTNGLFLVVDQMIWVEEPAPEGEVPVLAQGVGAYVQYDRADPDVLDLAQHFGIGATWRGAISGRDDDVAGIGASLVQFTDAEAAGYADEPEAALEAFYRVQVTPGASVQPYAQFIYNPGGAGLDNAVNLGFRVEVAF
ncbi:MAG TPA: carbohydrate porin [Phycisphaerales bacterium]|nr:carbohydrate porin [Phycisphaerales bacterium]